MQSGRQQQEPTEATQEWLNAAPERRRNLRPSGRGGCQIIRRHLASDTHKNRTSLPKALCQHFSFHDARSEPQIGGCNKALRELERAGHFTLPVSCMPKTVKSPRRLNVAVPEPVDVPALAGDVQGLALVKVASVEQMRIWNERMICVNTHRVLAPWWAANCAT